MRIAAFVDEGLGHSSYLVELEEAVSLVIDPLRFPDSSILRAGATSHVVAADTHTHADYVSGAAELGARGAEVIAPRDARLEFGHRGIDPGTEMHLTKSFSLRAIATPGHTPDHLAYLLLESGRPRALFSGGSLMVGTVGRTDLFGATRTEELARALYRSVLEEILVLPDELPVYPTHGAGSFCSAPGTNARTTTIGRERRTNPLLAGLDEDMFVERLVRGLGTFPTYYTRLPEVNRRGPRLSGGVVPALTPITPADVQRAVVEGALVVDARPVRAFAHGHVPGAFSDALRPAFASWLGWLHDGDRPLVLVLDAEQDGAELVRQAMTVGFDHIVGFLEGGMTAWGDEGLPQTTIALATAEETSGPIIDVRQRDEYVAGHVPGARHVELGALASSPLPDGPLTLMCGHGERAMSGASMLLAAQGRTDVRVLLGGPADWSARTGVALATGR